MRHPRGIDLLSAIEPVRHHEPSTHLLETLSMMREWEVLGAKCGKCGHIAWLDPKRVIRNHGNQYLQNMGGKLRCGCGNKQGNTVLIGTLGRD